MSVISKKEFAKICGIRPNHVATYAKRKKVIVQKNGDIDMSEELNKAFYSSQRAKGKGEDYTGVVVVTPPDVDTKQHDKQLTLEDQPVVANANLTKLTEEHERMKLEKTKKEVELKQLQIQKTMGQVIPTDLVYDAIKVFAETTKKAYQDGTENFIILMGQRKKMTGKEISEIRTELIDLINETVTQASESAKQSIKFIVEQYADSNGVGQRKAV